jgi:solute carrier family 44 (choline transporter-like protein), member 2/4/5
MLAICAASFIGFLCIYNKLRLAVAIIKTAAIFVKDEFLIILVPPVSAVFLFGLWIWWIITAM